MRRLTHSIPPPAPVPYVSENIMSETRKYTLITALFGGGSATHAYDPVTTIRVPEFEGTYVFGGEPVVEQAFLMILER